MAECDSKQLLAFAAFSTAVKYLLHCMAGTQRPSNARKVGEVRAINLYPAKSMAGISLQQCQCTYAGLEEQGIRDRQWMVVTATRHTFVSARAHPKLVTIQTSIHGGDIHLNAPNMETLVLKKDLSVKDHTYITSQVWGQNIGGIDVGDTAAAWIEQVLGKPSGSFRLLYHASQLDSRILVKQDDDWMRQCKPQDEVQYQDGFPYLLISGASLDSLEQSLKDAGVKDTNIDMKQFRPNIEVEGCDAYAEDSWKEIYIGDDVKFTNMKPCGRCTMTTVNAHSGVKRKDGEPLKTLQRVRPSVEGSPTFGINLVADRPGIISVGHPVYAVL